MTAVPVYANLALEWRPESSRNHRFNVMAASIVAFALVVALLMSSIELPKEERRASAPIPERVARFIQQREKPKVEKPVPKPPEPKPVIKRIQREKPLEQQKPLTRNEEKARKKAEKSGLLALGKELSDLMDTSSVSTMVGKKVTRAGNATQATTVNTEQLTANAGQGSGGVSSQQYIASTGTTTLTEQERLEVRQALKKGAEPGKELPSGTRRQGDNIRSEEDIKFVLDQNKSSLHALYRQARRKNASLKGKLVLMITIQSSGEVSDVMVKSSELNDPQLELRLIARIKQFTFGASKAVPVTITFPIEFLPS